MLSYCLAPPSTNRYQFEFHINPPVNKENSPHDGGYLTLPDR